MFVYLEVQKSLFEHLQSNRPEPKHNDQIRMLYFLNLTCQLAYLRYMKTLFDSLVSIGYKLSEDDSVFRSWKFFPFIIKMSSSA